MFTTTRHFNKFDIDDAEDRAEYETVLNNPAVTILSTFVEKLEETQYSDEGRPIAHTKRPILVVTWEERIPS